MYTHTGDGYGATCFASELGSQHIRRADLSSILITDAHSEVLAVPIEKSRNYVFKFDGTRAGSLFSTSIKEKKAAYFCLFGDASAPHDPTNYLIVSILKQFPYPIEFDFLSKIGKLAWKRSLRTLLYGSCEAVVARSAGTWNCRRCTRTGFCSRM